MDLDTNALKMTQIFEAVLDSDRLSLIAHLSQEELSLIDLSNRTELPPKDIQRHLEVLGSANLIKSREHAGTQVYRFNPKHIEHINRRSYSQPKNEDYLDSLELSKENRKIVADYTNPDGSLKMIPTKAKKIIAVLEYLVTSFDYGIDYSEQQVNDILEKYYADTTTLRRYLIDYRCLGRSSDGASYWREESMATE